MKIVTSSRRQLVMAVLLALALLGAALRYGADNPSLARDIGTLLLVLWLPAVGNLVAFFIGKLPRRQRTDNDFAAGAPFTSHLRAELTAQSTATGAPTNLETLERRCTLIVGEQGFTARLGRPLVGWPPAGTAQTVDLELLRPAVALRILPPSTVFHVLAGTTVVAKGRVI